MELLKLTPDQFERFQAFIYQQSGIHIEPKKITMLSNRIRRRLKAGAFTDFDAYYRHLSSRAGREELQFFLDNVTTHETSFLRTPQQFEWLKNEFVTGLVKAHRAGTHPAEIKIWSAGCSTGAEAYSMAMCLGENAFRLRNWKLDILGTDISQANIADAQRGIYKDTVLSLLSPEQRRRWLQPAEDGQWSVHDSLRKMTRFHHHNLMQPLGEAGFDCVFIRNVLIYFDAASKRTAVAQLLRALRPGGYLVIGPSEGIHDLLGSLQRIEPLIYRRRSDEATALPAGRRARRQDEGQSSTGDVRR